jgi:hypothetical protein
MEFISDDTDFIGRYENLQDDANKLANRLSGRNVGGVPLGHDQKSKRPKCGYDSLYTDETMNIIAEKYGAFIERFGYKFLG